MSRDSGGLDAALIEYYEQEVALGRRREVRAERVRLRDEFIAVLTAEGRRSVIDVGSGPGLDTGAFVAAGLDAVGLDLAPGNAAAMIADGIDGVCGSLYDPPFADGTFDAVWSMSTLVHVPDARFDEAVAAMVRLVSPGGPVAIGTWGGRDWEGVSEFGDIRPSRFFALRSHERAREMFERHGVVERFDAAPIVDRAGWEYQFVVLRRR